MLSRIKQFDPAMTTKSGIMVGLGETLDEVAQTMSDLRDHDVDLLTVGQYLQPDARHLPVVRFWHPDEYAEIKAIGERLGFAHVEAGPFVRSSYHAGEQSRAAGNIAPASAGAQFIAPGPEAPSPVTFFETGPDA
jgi:lipoic acid synthetase